MNSFFHFLKNDLIARGLSLAFSAYSALSVLGPEGNDPNHLPLETPSREAEVFAQSDMEFNLWQPIFGVVEEEETEEENVNGTQLGPSGIHITAQYAALYQSCRQQTASRSSTQIRHWEYASSSVGFSAILLL